MKKLLIFLFAIISLNALGQSYLNINQLNHAKNGQVNPYAVICLGNSFTATYPTDLQIFEPGWSVFNKGVGGQTSYQIAARAVTYSTLWNQGIWIIEMGRNDSLLAGNKIDTANIKTHLASTIAKLPSNARYIILPIPKDTTQTNGSFGSDQINTMNAIFLRLYPTQYADYYTRQLSNGNHSPADNYNISRGLTPKSLLADNIHYNTQGWINMAHYLDSVIQARFYTPLQQEQINATTDIPQIWSTPPQLGFLNPSAANFTYIKTSSVDTVAGMYNSGSATIQGALTLNNGFVQTYTVPSGTNQTAKETDVTVGSAAVSNTLNAIFAKITASGSGTVGTSYLFNGSYTGTNLAGITNLNGIGIFGEAFDHFDGSISTNGTLVLNNSTQLKMHIDGTHDQYLYTDATAGYWGNGGSGGLKILNTYGANDLKWRVGGTDYTVYTTGNIPMTLSTTNTWTGLNTFQAGLYTSGPITASAWGTAGINFQAAGATYTDNSTAAGATVTNAMINTFASPTILASNGTSGSHVTYTNAATLYIAGAPSASTNTNITNSYALDVASGNTNLAGTVAVGSTLTVGGSGNIQIPAANSFSRATTSFYQFGGSSGNAYRVIMGGATGSTLTAGDNYSGAMIGSGAVTTASSGTHGIIANGVVNALGAITSGGSTVTETANFYVAAQTASIGGTNWASDLEGKNLIGAPTLKYSTVAINSTATVTASQLSSGYLTSTSAAAVTMTLPTATQMATQLGAVQGYTFKFYVDNTAGANTVTIALGSGMTQLSTITGANTLTIPSGTTGIGVFELVFSSNSACTISRLE